MASRVASLQVSALDDSRPLEPELEHLIEATAARLQAGEAVDLEELIASRPEYADQLRELLPAVELLVRMGNETPEPPINGAPGNGVPRALPHQQLGNFRLLRELGRGGMGTVYEAEQLSMGRHVALKVLPFAALVDNTSLQRFRNEVRAAAALNHPNIVSVYSVGEERGVHFYAMQLIRGRTLAEMIHELRTTRQGVTSAADGDHVQEPAIDSARSVPPSTKRDEQARLSTAADSRQAREFYRMAARLGVQAAEALQHAHDQGVLHRDIKPGNLMVDADAQLYVTDFGLARIEADAGLTLTGDIIGTLRYMAPEQALAKPVVIDQRADVYSLGATIYELLTLQPAFAETDRAQLLKQIAFEEPRPLRKLDRRIPAELETIVLKAMAKSPEGRYQTADRLAEDLRAFLENRPIKAKPPTLANRVTKWSRRHVAIVWSAAAVLLITSLVLMVANIRISKWYREAEQNRLLANDDLQEKERQAQAARAAQASEEADRAQNEGKWEQALARWDQALQFAPDNADWLYGRCNAHLELSQYAKALADADRILDLDCEDSTRWQLRAGVHCMRQEYDEALADYSKAIELQPNDMDLRTGRAQVALFRRQFDESRVRRLDKPRIDRIAIAPSQFAGSAAAGSLTSIGSNPPPYGFTNDSVDQGWIWKAGNYFTVDLIAPKALQQFRVWSVYPGDLTGRGARWEILSSDDGLSFTHEADFTYLVGGGLHGVNDDGTARSDSTGWFEADFNAAAVRHRFWQVKDVATLIVHSPRSAQVEFYGPPNGAGH